MSTLRLAVLASGSGSNLQALIDAGSAGDLLAEIAVVVSDRADAYALQRALQQRIPAIYLPLRRGEDRRPWAARLAALLSAFDPDLLVMAGWMKIMPAEFVERFRIINQHPALLPGDDSDVYVTSSGVRIPAIRGAHAVRDALALGLPVTGCTVHWVTPEVDAGPVLGRVELPVLPGDTEETLHERIKEQERRLLIRVINDLARGNGAVHATGSPGSR